MFMTTAMMIMTMMSMMRIKIMIMMIMMIIMSMDCYDDDDYYYYTTKCIKLQICVFLQISSSVLLHRISKSWIIA